MINWKKAEFADYIKVILKDGMKIIGMGNGISLAEDFDDEEYAKDTFFIASENGTVAIDMSQIEDIIFYGQYI